MSDDFGRRLAETRLEIMVEATLAGHDLAPVEPADTGNCQARRRRSGLCESSGCGIVW